MSNSFNLNSFKDNSYLKDLCNPTNLYENAHARMEERDIENAKVAVEGKFGDLTLTEKLSELGLGKRVIQQIGDTATGIVRELVDPIAEYLEKYEDIFDPEIYNGRFQGYAKQLFFNNQSLKNYEASKPVGRNFEMNM